MTETAYRSVSQFKEYEQCPYAYKLHRVDRAWQRPAAWLAQGTAAHKAWEEYERSGRELPLTQAEEVYADTYAAEIGEYCKGTPDFNWWFPSGPYRGATDVERRYRLGMDMVERYYGWYASHPDQVIWIAQDGTPCIELEFDIDLDGVIVRGFIDAVVEVDGKLRVRDGKTGKSPGDEFQLGVYAVAVEELFGVERPTKGDYWMGATGKPTVPYDLSEWSYEHLADEFGQLDENIRAKRFDPNPSKDNCRFCSVSAACEYAV